MNFNRFLLVPAFLTLLSVTGVEAHTETFYLRANGNGAAPKTIEGAFGVNDFNNSNNWGTDDENDGKIGPNDRVIVLDDDGVFRPASAGQAYSNLLIIRGSGIAGKPVTIQGEDGGNPTLLGSLSKNNFTDWTNESGNLWKTINGSFFVDPGFVLVGAESQANVAVRQKYKNDLNADREWYYDSTNDCVYFYNDGGNPAIEHKNIEIGAVERIIFSDKKKYITVKELTLKYSARNGFWIESPANWLIDSCTVKFGGGHDCNGTVYDGNAIAYYRGATNSTITKCNVSQWHDIGICLETGYSYENASNIIFSNNKVDSCGGGINAQLVSDKNGISIDNVLITNNTVTNAGSGYGMGEGGYGIGAGSTGYGDISEVRNITITNNHIDTFASDGINITGGINYNVQKNFITNGDRKNKDRTAVGGIKIRGDPWSDVTGIFAYNVILYCDVPGIELYYNNGLVEIYNNIIYKCGDTYKITYGNSTIRFTNSDKFIFKNNIVVSKSDNEKTPYHALHINNKPSNATLDNNIYFKESGVIVRYPLDKIYNTSVFLNYQQSINNEFHSMISDPLFTDPANKVFTLQSKSPAIDAGVNIGLKSDFKGNPIVGLPDIGPYEYQTSTTNPLNPPKNLGVVLISAKRFPPFYGGQSHPYEKHIFSVCYPFEVQ